MSTATVRAFAHGAADLMTIGCWEVLGTPAELAFDGTQLRIQVTYSERDCVDSAMVIGKDGAQAIDNVSRTGYKTALYHDDPAPETRAVPSMASEEAPKAPQAAPKPPAHAQSAPKTVKGETSSSFAKLATSLLAGAKRNFNQRQDGPIRVAVYRFVPRDETGAKGANLGERITSELERALVGQPGFELVTRKNLSDIQAEQRLNEAHWNQSSEKQRQFGVSDADLILRGNYSVSNSRAPVRLECELLDPRSGVVVGATEAVVEIGQQ